MAGQALILFAHGARAPSWVAPFERLRTLTRARMPAVRVELAFLELMTPPLDQLVAALVADGIDDITVVPVFLGQGGHVLRDLPLLIARLRGDYPALALRAVDAVGEDATVLAAISDYCVAAASAAP